MQDTPIEPFNMKSEKSEGYIDESGFFVHRKKTVDLEAENELRYLKEGTSDASSALRSLSRQWTPRPL